LDHGSLPLEETYFKQVGLTQFDNYGDFEGFSHVSPPETALTIWSFFANKTSPDCSDKPVFM
jgi:hypothetical protein